MENCESKTRLIFYSEVLSKIGFDVSSCIAFANYSLRCILRKISRSIGSLPFSYVTTIFLKFSLNSFSKYPVLIRE